MGLIPGLGKTPGGGDGNPLQYSCLENPMDTEAWQAMVHGVAKSQTHLSMHAHYTIKYFITYNILMATLRCLNYICLCYT